MTIQQLLEFNMDRMVNDFGMKLENHFYQEYRKKLPSAEIIQKIADMDPTQNKELTFWVANNYANWEKDRFNGGISRFEDIGSRAFPELLNFKKILRFQDLSKDLPTRDVNQIKGLRPLEKIVDPVLAALKDKKKELEVTNHKSIENQLVKDHEVTIIYNGPDIKVVEPHTEKASCFFGINTKWCTAGKNRNAFDSYNARGPLYIVLIKKTNERYQFHWKTKQFMDEQDRSINPNELGEKYPVLYDIFTPIANKNNSFILNKDPWPMIKKNPSLLAFLPNPPKEKVEELGFKQVNYIIPGSTERIKGAGWEGPLTELPSELLQKSTARAIKRHTQTISSEIEKRYNGKISITWENLHCVLSLEGSSWSQVPTWKYYISGVDNKGNTWGIKDIESWKKKNHAEAALYLNGKNIGNPWYFGKNE